MANRTCIFIPISEESYFPGKGIIPSVVKEGVPGHTPLMGNGPFASPYHWGGGPYEEGEETFEKVYASACRLAEMANRERGLSKEDVNEIILLHGGWAGAMTPAGARYARNEHVVCPQLMGIARIVKVRPREGGFEYKVRNLGDPSLWGGVWIPEADVTRFNDLGRTSGSGR